jgi:hypothetical protein
MNPWLKVFVKASGFGVGAAVAAGIIIGAWVYISSLPETPRPWNREAIKATFADLYVNTGDRIVATFRYTVENKTKNDYYLPNDVKSVFVALPEGKGLSQEDEITWGHGAYLPSGQKVSTSFQMTYDYDESFPQKECDNLDKLSKFMNRRLRKLDGFVVLDKKSRYEIVFPKGWKDTDEKKK